MARVLGPKLQQRWHYSIRYHQGTQGSCYPARGTDSRGDIAGEIGELQVAQGVIPNEDVHPLLRRDEEGILLRLGDTNRFQRSFRVL